MVLHDNQARQLLLAILTSSALVVAGATTVVAQDPSASPAADVEVMASPIADGGQPDGMVPTEVEILDFTFPADIMVEAGSSIVWQNADPISHTVTATDGSFDSGRIEPATTFELAFDEAGVFAYSCLFHPAMTGTITVVAADGGPDMSPAASDEASPEPEMTTQEG